MSEINFNHQVFLRTQTRFFTDLNKAIIAQEHLAKSEKKTVYINQLVYGNDSFEYSLRFEHEILDKSAPNIIMVYIPKNARDGIRTK